MSAQRMIGYREALEGMRKYTPSGDPVPFSLGWFEGGENEGRYREEHGLIMAAELKQLNKTHITVRYQDGDHHDTRIRIRNLYMFNGMRIYL